MKTVIGGLVVSGLVFCVTLPLWGENYLISLFFFVFMYITLASSWNIISGFTGYVSFGHVAFWGIGSYGAAVIITHFGWHWIPASILGGVVAVVLAFIIGYPCLKLKGPYFVIAMLGLNEIVRIFVTLWDSVTFGGEGMNLPPVLSLLSTYTAMGIVALATVGTTYVIANSKFGLRLLAIREDEVGAEVMGINTTFYKLAAFVLSAFFAGVVGGIYAWHMSYIEPESSFALLVTIEMIIMAMFGGRATVLGPVIGATFLYLASEIVWARFPEAHLALYGLLIIVVVLYMPQGVMGMMRVRGWVPRGW